ncbi:hypothetical protein RYX36_012543 [Vicia faba]
MDNDDCDLFSILHSCNANTFQTLPPPQNLITTSTITNNIISPQNTTPSYFDDFSLTQENRSVSFSPLKPTDFIELDKLKTNFNPTIPIPTHKSTTINHDSNQNFKFFDFPTLIPEPQMQTTDITTHIPTINNLTTNIPSATFANPSLPSNIFTTSSTTAAPSITTMINTSTSFHGTNNYPKIHNSPNLFEQQQIQQNQNNHLSSIKPVTCIEITKAHFDLAYNHPSFSKQYTTDGNQLPNLQPHTDPQQELCKNRKRKFDDQKIVEWHISVDKLGEDPWEWRKYGQKPIKGSRHLRDYYKCSNFKDCVAKKQVEKKPNKENIYVVTYIGEHNHPKPVVNWPPHKKSSKKKSSNVKKYGSLSNIRNSDSQNMVMSHIDQPECSNAQVHRRQSKSQEDE